MRHGTERWLRLPAAWQALLALVAGLAQAAALAQAH